MDSTMPIPLVELVKMWAALFVTGKRDLGIDKNLLRQVGGKDNLMSLFEKELSGADLSDEERNIIFSARIYLLQLIRIEKEQERKENAQN